MKKRVMSLLLVVTLSMTAITGCGAKETVNEASKETMLESVAEPTEAPIPEPTEVSALQSTAEQAGEATEVPEPEYTVGTTDVSAQDSIVEATDVLVSESTPEASEAPTAEPLAEPTQAAQGTESSTEVDWSTAYDDYFERENTTYENVKMSTSISRDGITFTIEVAAAGENTYMNFDFDTMGLEMYINQEKVYTCTKMKGQNIWEYALLESEADAEDMKEMGEIIDTNNYEFYEYYDEVIEDGVVYDVLYIAHEDAGEVQQEGYCYINRETQLMEKITATANDQEAVVYFEEIDGIELPAEVMTATETTMEEIATTMLTIIFMGSLSQMEGLEY